MKIKYAFILLFSIINVQNFIYSQYTKTMYSYKGNAGDNSIYFWYDITLTFDIPITGQLTSVRNTGANQGLYSENIKSDAIINNSLSNVSRVITPQSNFVTYSVNETPVDDFFQSNIFFDVAPNYNNSSVNFKIYYDNMNTTVNLDNAVYSPYIAYTFPITSTLPSSVLKYLNASPYVESTNSSIISTAQSITSGCTDLRTAIIKLSQWIEAYIKMIDNTPNKSSEVYSNRYGDCDGAAHLLAAFCRSLNIPARIVSGYFIEHPVPYPINQSGSSVATLGSGSGTALVGHSACEIYVPYMNGWVRCDPAQRTTLFGPQAFIKTATGLESTNHLRFGSSFSYTLNQPIKPTKTTLSVNQGVFTGTKVVNYKFVKSETFPGTYNTINNFGLLCAADPTLSVGFNDKVTIDDPKTGTTWTFGQVPLNTYSMTACLPANFYAKFVSETTPQTFSTGFDWSIVLYKANGDEYVYAQQNGIISNTSTPNDYGEGCFWQPNIGVLPAYDWLYDPSGNIYGKVKITVHISDGDTKYDETTIGVSPYNNIQNVIYNANTTINACAKLNLTNVNITGTPTVIFNTNGLGITINGTFEAPLGSTLIINP
ncbi:MAG: transglutaminase-like domain-containing protein [Bacteroidales bacterium]